MGILHDLANFIKASKQGATVSDQANKLMNEWMNEAFEYTHNTYTREDEGEKKSS